MEIWWNGGRLRELLNATSITKWNYTEGIETSLLDGRNYNCQCINSSKSNPCFYADIMDDWREEVI